MFSIYLKETNKSLSPNFTLLDTEDIDVSTVFSISDISDISSRKDTITKNITFKGTSRNNNAFGYHFFLNKHLDRKLNDDGTDDLTDERIFFNYIPSRKVDCMIYEDSILILNGSMLLTSANIDKDGNISYNSIVTGKIVTLKSTLGDKLLTGNANEDDDIDFIDLKHQYVSQVIEDSWGASALNSAFIDQTQRYDADTETYSYKAFEKGSGYVYPFIDYGEKFQDDSYNEDYSRVNIHNYRPAIYVKEYMDRILKKAGLTYELKGNGDFIDRFNSLIIPDSSDVFKSIGNGNASQYTRDSQSSPLTEADEKYVTRPDNYTLHPLPMPISSSHFTMVGAPFGFDQNENTLIQFTRAITTTVHLDVEIDDMFNRSGSGIYGDAVTANIIVEVVRRKYSTDYGGTGEGDYLDVVSGWDILGSDNFYIESGDTQSHTFNIDTLPITFALGDQVYARVKLTALWLPTQSDVYQDSCTYSITNVNLTIPKSITDSYILGVKDGDYIIPKPPDNIKQFDFVKSVLTLLNLYIYNENENPTHLFLQPYDDFYSLCKVPYLKTNALNWTNKIDYSNGLSINSNLDLPNKYNFTFKEDSDYLNKTYKDKYGEIYGSYTSDDKLGLTDTKAIELIFSPTPMIEINGLQRIYPFIADGGTSLKDKTVIKSNIRVLFYNGGAYTTSTIFSEDGFGSDTVPTIVDDFTSYVYGQASNYYMSITSDTTAKTSTYTAIYDIHFSHPKELYFQPSTQSEYLDDTIPTSYGYYFNQINEMIDPNLFLINCTALLNEIDIGNLDFHYPIFIDTGDYGHSYFKLQTIEYSDNKTPSKITLQKIVI
jgi:hypothetical protein